MGGFEHEMLGFVDELSLVAGVAAPKQKDEVRAILIQVFDDVFGESLPAFGAVAAGMMRLDGQNVV